MNDLHWLVSWCVACLLGSNRIIIGDRPFVPGILGEADLVIWTEFINCSVSLLFQLTLSLILLFLTSPTRISHYGCSFVLLQRGMLVGCCRYVIEVWCVTMKCGILVVGEYIYSLRGDMLVICVFLFTEMRHVGCRCVCVHLAVTCWL